ncbi:V-type proton ATPase subunit G 2-like [Scleropages formosus]|uniref:V-type proton ATPase subunit G n=1 Tax=Scleropages formosus TaxID=113540 RepID=A0A0P7UDR2_SCLFO|nr:V-type proton ATPase subunit G 2-like [Scleropages formosus]
MAGGWTGRVEASRSRVTSWRARDRAASQSGGRRGGAERNIIMASQSQGIQQLLQAEKRAAEKVSEARKRKTRRLKQAKEEAQAEIEQYRREREREFAQKQHTVLGSQGGFSSEVEQQTKQKIQAMTKSYRSNRERVLRDLLTITCQINPQIHCNYHCRA